MSFWPNLTFFFKGHTVKIGFIEPTEPLLSTSNLSIWTHNNKWEGLIKKMKEGGILKGGHDVHRRGYQKVRGERGEGLKGMA